MAIEDNSWFDLGRLARYSELTTALYVQPVYTDGAASMPHPTVLSNAAEYCDAYSSVRGHAVY